MELKELHVLNIKRNNLPAKVDTDIWFADYAFQEVQRELFKSPLIDQAFKIE